MLNFTREQRKQLARDNAKQPPVLTPVPIEQWPANGDRTRIAVWRSRDYLVQMFDVQDEKVIARLSVSRTSISGDRWRDGLSWDELQRIKAEVGFAMKWAVEVYPSVLEEVNVANIRHLWVYDEAPAYAWQRTTGKQC